MKSKLIMATLAVVLVASLCKEEGQHAAPVGAQPAAGKTGKIVFKIVGFRGDQGKALMLLFKNGKGFPGEVDLAVAKADANIKNKTATIVFDNQPYGSYAASILHDEDGDQKLKSSMIGIPKEGTGASNDARGKMGPPKAEDALFRLDGPVFEQTIKMQYF